MGFFVGVVVIVGGEGEGKGEAELWTRGWR